MGLGPGKKAPPTSNAMIIDSDGPELEEHDVGRSEQQDTFIQLTCTQDMLVLSDNQDGGGIENDYNDDVLTERITIENDATSKCGVKRKSSESGPTLKVPVILHE